MKPNPNKFRWPLLALGLLLVGGCRNTFDNANRISSGMTKAELLAAVGDPKQSMSPGSGVEILRFEFIKPRLYRLAVPLRQEYMVRLVNGRVDAYAPARDFRKLTLETNAATVNVNVRREPGQ